MKTRSKIIAALLAASVSGMALAANAEATAPAPATTEATAVAAPAEIVSASDIAISEAGRKVVMGLQFAQMALAQGETEAASKIVADISGMFGDDDAALMIKTDAGYGLPLETGLSLAEGFEPSKEQAPALAAVQKLMAHGDVDGAIAELNKAGVEVSVQIVLLPYKSTMDGLKQATADLKAGDTDKAGAALEAIAASVAFEGYAIDELPAQGYPMADILKG